MDMFKEADPNSLAPLEDQLRSPQLMPRCALDTDISEAERQQIVAAVVSGRSQLLSSHETTAEGTLDQTDMGRLLIYNPRENVADGASRYSSKGFFDFSDAPPWDTWVYYAQGELISWVPADLVPIAQEGIDANPVECIRWADSNSASKFSELGSIFRKV
jgi:hypothetical protein